MRYIKTYEEISDNDFNNFRNEFKKKLDTFIKDFNLFSLNIGSKYWRSTGNIYSELNKLSNELDNYTKANKKEVSVNLFSFRTPEEQEWLLINFPELAKELDSAVNINSEIKKKYDYLFDSEGLGLL